jgi:uncharacterized protein (TIGR00297 family)
VLSTGIWLAIAVSVAFAVLARAIRGVSASGAVAGALACFVLIAGAGFGAFVALVSVFVLTWGSTRFGYQRKQKLGTAEKRNGRRASQVLANIGVAAVCALLFAVSGGRRVFLLCLAAGLAEAAADTTSSEIGQASSTRARLITTWGEVPAGTDGGVSVMGTAAGLTAAVIVSAVCCLAGLVPWRWMGASVTAAMAGVVADSYLGAWLQPRGILNNDGINVLGTLVAALVAALIA